FAPILLAGVTGSGKTEVYFEAIAEALAAPAGQVLVLLPEIALTSQWLDRFCERFGAEPAPWHSDLALAARRRTWLGTADGSVRVVVGARSALFLPFRDLRLIVVDEEHDPSYKQDEAVCYHARDMAVVRASIEGIPVALASATPSLETLANVARGRYRRLDLADRHGGAAMPVIAAIDLRAAGPEPGQWIAPALAGATTETLERGEQTLLFLNRRGYAPVTLCRACGGRLECPRCTAWLVDHRYTGRVTCHHCGYSLARPHNCAACGSADTLVPCGPGVERLAEEVARRWPEARLAVLSSDTAGSPERLRELVARIEAGAIDIVIGTQIVTKGYHFPRLTLVGVIDADLGLRGGDLRAGERTYQQIMQVAGRAGRAAHPGRVLLQTYDPDHPVTAALIAGDEAAFLAREAEARQRAGMPPFGRLAALLLSARREEMVREAANRLARAIPRTPGIEVFGPAPAPLARLRGRFRYRFLVKARREVALQAFLRRWLAAVAMPGSVRLRVDVDPQSFQ
ncbi:MAG: primosomal protein N', partial [Rhodothalassiaceae bacterium]